MKDSGQIVFVVDDHELVRNLIETVLQDAGLQVLTAGSAAEAIRLFREHFKEIGCVLQDLSMPHMRGEEIAVALLEFDPSARIIVMSVDDEVSAREQLRDIAIAGYLQKPFEPEVLISMIRLQMPAAEG